jgi:hypothetical protein
MTATLTAEVLGDPIAVSLACVIAVANKRARQLGIDVEQSLITIAQHFTDGGVLWRINYGPKDYIGRRGGDLIIEVDPSDVSIKRVLWEQ